MIGISEMAIDLLHQMYLVPEYASVLPLAVAEVTDGDGVFLAIRDQGVILESLTTSYEEYGIFQSRAV